MIAPEISLVTNSVVYQGRRRAPPYLETINPLRQIISGSTSSIFTKFSPYGRYVVVDYGSGLQFRIAQGTLPWQPILASKLAKSAYSSLFVALAFGDGLYCNIAILIFVYIFGERRSSNSRV